MKNFLDFQNIDIELIYKKGSWKRLCVEAGVLPDFYNPNEVEITRCLGKKLLQCNSISYLNFIKQLINNRLSISKLNSEQQLLLLMFHYDVWLTSGPPLGFQSLSQSIEQILKNKELIEELEEIVDYLISKIAFVEKDIELNYAFPLKVHSRYNRDQILVALKLHQFDKASSNREGVALNKELNTEALFITLKKSEKEYSPTTLYDDYAINEYLFHWQSQNATAPESPKGISYIKHDELNKKILLFVREQNDDEFGFTISYVFLGEAKFVNSTGARPMNIEWQLNEPMPAYIWKESGKLAIG